MLSASVHLIVIEPVAVPVGVPLTRPVLELSESPEARLPTIKTGKTKKLRVKIKIYENNTIEAISNPNVIIITA